MFVADIKEPQSQAICNDYSVKDVSSHKSLEVVLHAFVKDSQLQRVSRAPDTRPPWLSTLVQFIVVFTSLCPSNS
jgi:hypothetical protein